MAHSLNGVARDDQKVPEVRGKTTVRQGPLENQFSHQLVLLIPDLLTGKRTHGIGKKTLSCVNSAYLRDLYLFWVALEKWSQWFQPHNKAQMHKHLGCIHQVLTELSCN